VTAAQARRGRPRRWLPQTFRVRFTLVFAALFLLVGAGLLGITYSLVAGLPVKVPQATPAQRKLALECKLGHVGPSKAPGAGPTPTATPAPAPAPSPSPSPVPIAQCGRAFSAVGAQEAAAEQRLLVLTHLLDYSLPALGLMTVVSGGIGWVMAGRVLRPVSSITAAARRASEQHLGERLALTGPKDELRELADTFDEMLERLDAAFATQRRFVADASHELRTPLTVMRTAIEVTMAKPARTPEHLEAMAAKVARSAAQAEALIEALLTLAASEQAPASPELTDLAAAAEDAVESAAGQARQLGLHIDTGLAAAPACGNRLLLERLVGNLVDNAVRHNIRGGWISIRTGTGDGRARFEIANSGPVIPAELIPALFEPFRRVEERTSTRDGTGLGLAIVRSIGTAHGASVEAHGLPAGGLRIVVALPVAPDGGCGPAGPAPAQSPLAS
jgi:signal transduction histidine kinase